MPGLKRKLLLSGSQLELFPQWVTKRSWVFKKKQTLNSCSFSENWRCGVSRGAHDAESGCKHSLEARPGLSSLFPAVEAFSRPEEGKLAGRGRTAGEEKANF